MMMNLEFARRYSEFLAAASRMRAELHGKSAYADPARVVPDLYGMEGSRYIRVVQSDHNSRSSYCWVDKTNGNVLKSAGWKSPETKHPRSNIFDADYGLSGLSLYGAKYLR